MPCMVRFFAVAVKTEPRRMTFATLAAGSAEWIMNILTFDIETIPDVASGRRLYGLGGLSDEEVARAMFQQRRQETGGSEFLPLHLHRVAAIAIALRRGDEFRLWSLGTPQSDEAELITRFYEGIEKFTPDLVTWNGGGFDFPVLHYRALHHGIAAPRYWETGETDNTFRWNNYLSRFHWRHIDLMDVLAGFQLRAAAPLDEIAQLCGLPGKLGMHGSRVWEAYLGGEIGRIRDYCEADTLNTYLIYLRFELMRGRLDAVGYRVECARVREHLARANKPHLSEFLKAWPAQPGPTAG
jgi:predicted PolB exonuclease-like 3'-5' exonuclease